MAGGRPSKYETHVKPYLDMIGNWARSGATDAQIADKLSISADTLITYKKQFSEFSDTLKRNKDVVDYEVENALLKRALGYEYDEAISEMFGEEGNLVVTKIVRKQVAPDVTAQIFWLKNRKPEEWRDKQEISGGVSVKYENPYAGLTTEELRKLAADGKK